MSKNYKILLSAYACEPNRGSEPGVGWNWAIELSKLGHEVHVITRANNQTLIEDFKKNSTLPENLYFHYYDLPSYIMYLKKKGLSVNLYYLLWQYGVLSKAKKIHHIINFQIIHHITFGVFRHPSFLYKLNVPFVFGPVGGSEHTPNNLMKTLNLKFRLIEVFRNTLNWAFIYNPILIKMYSNTLMILSKTEETKQYIPKKFHLKTINQLEIGISQTGVSYNVVNNSLNVLYVGRLIYWKGLKLSLLSFKQTLLKLNNSAMFTIVGSGEQKEELFKLVDELQIKENVTFVEWVSQKELSYYYQKSDVLLFTSYHDSSGNVVLEALSNGLPVVTLDCGGPAQVLGSSFKDLIVNTNNSVDQIINDLSDRMIFLNDSTNRLIFSNLAIQRAKEMLWSNVVENTYRIVEEKLNEKE